MQVTNIAGVKTAGEKMQNGIRLPERKLSREEAAAAKAEGATVTISAEGLGLVKKEEQEERASAREAAEKQMYQEMLENTKEAAEAQGEGYEDLAKALEIARRILNGDIVPAQDEKFLMEYNSEIYMRVKSMAETKEDPEEYDSLLEEEEEDDNGSGSGSSVSGSGASGAAGGNEDADVSQAEGEAAASEENA